MFSIEIQGTAFFELLFNGSHMKRMRELTSKGVTEQVKLWYRTLPDSYFDNPSPFPDGTSRRRGGRTFVPPLADAWSYHLQGSTEFSVEFKHPRAHGVPWGLRLHHKGIENMRPVNALALTIPVTNEAVKRRARDFPHKLFMVTKHAMGEKIGSLCWADDVGKVHAAYVLMKSVRIPSLQERKGLPAIPKDEELRGFMEEMRGKLGDYTKQVRELQMEYYRLQKRSGEMSAEFISQVTTLRKQVEETQEQLSPLLKKIVDLQVEVNDLKEKTRQTGKEFTKSGEEGARAYRSMRAMVRDFVVNLVKGKVAIGELATAMKGLMYSTAILAAIQAAMEGIRYVGTKIKEAFTENEEAAKNAAEALKNAENSAMNAQAAIAATGEAMKDAAQERSLERQAAAIASSYKEQRDAAQATVEAINAQAKAEARRQALMAKMEDHEREMLKMQLKIDLLDEKITPEQYRKRLADLDVQQVQANAQRANEAARRNEAGVQRTWSSAMEAQRVAGEEYAKRKADLDKMTPADIIEAVEEQLKTVRKERDELRKQLDEATEKGLPQETLDELYQKWNEAADQAGELYDQLQRMGNTKEEYAFAKKNAEEALKNLQAAKQAFQRAEAAWNEAHGNTLATQEEGRVDVTQAEQRRDKTNSLIDAEDRSNKRKKNEQQQKKDADAKEKAKQRRQEMERLAADIAEQAQIAAGTSKDTDDKAVLDKIRKAKDKYGAVFDKVLAQQNGIVSAVEMLQASTDRNERTLKELQGRIDKLIKQGKVQDTRSKKRTSL